MQKFKQTLLILLVSGISYHGFSQSVGVNTLLPDSSAILDIKSSDKGLLIPRMKKTDRLAIVNPAQGLLVFDRDFGSFFFYNGVEWLDLATSEMGVWLKENTILPAMKTDTSIYFMGHVAIGKDTAEFPFDLYADSKTGIKIELVHDNTEGDPTSQVQALHVKISGKSNSVESGLLIENDASTSTKYGVATIISPGDSLTYHQIGAISEITGVPSSGDSLFRINQGVYTRLNGFNNTYQVGFHSYMNGSTYANQRGTLNEMRGSGDGEHIGTYNYYSNANGVGDHFGVKNLLTGSGEQFGTYQQLSPSSNLNAFGVYSEINGTSNHGAHYGAHNQFEQSNSNGNHYGVFNNFIQVSSDGDHYGVYNSLKGSSNDGERYGTYNTLEGTGSGKHVGSGQYIDNNEDGQQTGSENHLKGNGNGNHRGTENVLFGDGSGDHYATFNHNKGDATGLQIGSYQFNSVLGDGDQYGVRNEMEGVGNGLHFGSQNILNGEGTGIHYGINNRMEGIGSGNQYGINTAVSNTGSGEHYGSYHSLTGVGSGIQMGTAQEIDNEGNATHIGVSNTISGIGTGSHFGMNNILIGTGSGNQYGSRNYISNGGPGVKTGTENALVNNSDATQYGINNLVSSHGNGDYYGTRNLVNGTGDGLRVAGYFHGSGSADKDNFAAIFNAGNVVANESGGNSDFRMESENDQFLFFLDADADYIGIGTDKPTEMLDIRGNTKISLDSEGTSPTLRLEEVGDDYSRLTFSNKTINTANYWSAAGRIYATDSDSRLNFFYKDFGNVLSLYGDGRVYVNHRLGIGDVTPDAAFDIHSNADEDPLHVHVGNDDKMRIYQNGSIALGGLYSGTPNDVFIVNQLGMGVSSPIYRLDIQNSITPSIGQARANAWTTYSDARVKKNVERISYGLKDILALRPVKYDHHSSEFEENVLVVKEEHSKAIGFIAQEVYEIIEEVVQKPEDEEKDLWSMDYEKLTPVLVQAIQEQQKLIDQLLKKTELLSNQLNAISSTNN